MAAINDDGVHFRLALLSNIHKKTIIVSLKYSKLISKRGKRRGQETLMTYKMSVTSK